MLDFFKKKIKQKAVFKTGLTYVNKDKYFYRVAEWDWIEANAICVIDPNAPRVLTLDPWPQAIFLSADGKKTILQYIAYMAEQYTGKIPTDLDKAIISEIENLLDENIIKLADNQTEIPDNVRLPKSRKK